MHGLEWSVKRRHAGHETLTHFALALRLVVARCLRRLGRLDDAEYSFKILAGALYQGLGFRGRELFILMGWKTRSRLYQTGLLGTPFMKSHLIACSILQMLEDQGAHPSVGTIMFDVLRSWTSSSCKTRARLGDGGRVRV